MVIWKRWVATLLAVILLVGGLPARALAEAAVPLPQPPPTVIPAPIPHPLIILLLLIATGVGGDNRIDESVWVQDDEADHATLSSSLALNMEVAGMGARPDCYAAHHIVAKNARLAENTRKVLEKWGVDIDDPANGIYLPQRSDPDCGTGEARHTRIHTSRYYVTVNNMMLRTTSREHAIATLRSIARMLQQNQFPY